MKPPARIVSPPAWIAPAQPNGSPYLNPDKSFDMTAFLRALAEVETGGKWQAIGSKGEIGAYQFRRLTWNCYSELPFKYAASPRFAPHVAAMHAMAIIGALRHCGKVATAYNVALIWKCGIKAYLENSAGPASRDHAERVSNLYQQFRPKR